MSKLLGIIQRLNTLQEQSETGEQQERYFEVNGKRICQVKYSKHQDMFEIEVFTDDKKKNSFTFDNIDITAIEIYELLQEHV